MRLCSLRGACIVVAALFGLMAVHFGSALLGHEYFSSWTCSSPVLQEAALFGGSNVCPSYFTPPQLGTTRYKSQHSIKQEMASFDVLTITVSQLRKLLDSNELSSLQVVKTYLGQITKHNLKGMKLRAMITIAPEESLFEQASKLDKERLDGISRGPLHGIPLIVKVRWLFVLTFTAKT